MQGSGVSRPWNLVNTPCVCYTLNVGDAIADIPLYNSQTAVLSAILRYAARGYTYHKTFTAPESKIRRALEVLQAKHQVFCSEEEQRIRRLANLPRARLVLAPEPQAGVWPLILLADRALAGETMKALPTRPAVWPSFRTQDEAWAETYALAARPATGRLSWALTRAAFDQLYQALELALHTGDYPAGVRLVRVYTAFPMFAGIHEQARALHGLIYRKWGDRYLRRLDGQGYVQPTWPKIPTIISPVRVRLEPRETFGQWEARNGRA